MSKINVIALLHENASCSNIKIALSNNNYKIDVKRAQRIFECLNLLSYNNSIKFNPYAALNVRALKRIDAAVGGLQFKIIEKITFKKNT